MATYVYNPALLSSTALGAAPFRLIEGTTTLYSFCQAADLTFKRVANFQQAATCGGVLAVDMVNGNWILLAGSVLEKALRRGESGWMKIRQQQFVFKRRRFHNKPLNPDPRMVGADGKGLAVSAAVSLKSVSTLSDFITSPDVLIMGLVTKASGYGIGRPRPNGDLLLENVNAGEAWPFSTSNESIADPRSAGWMPSFNSPALDAANRAAYNEELKSAHWCLWLDADMGLARDYFKQNKAAMIAEWKTRGAPSDEVLGVYSDCFETAVNAVFTATDRLTSQIPFLGGNESITWQSDLRFITAHPSVDLSFLFINGSITPPAADIVALSEEEIAWQGSRFVQHFGFATDAPIATGLRREAQFTRTLMNAPFEFSFGGEKKVRARELVAAVSPAAAIAMASSPVSGIAQMENILADYANIDLPDMAPPNSGANISEMNAAIVASRDGAPVYPDVYLGGLGRAVINFGKAWDQVAQDSGG